MKELINENILFLTITVSIEILNSVAVMVVPFFIYRVLLAASGFNISQLLVVTGLMIFSCLLQLSLIVIRENHAVKYNIANFKAFLLKLFRMDYDNIIQAEPTSLIERIGMATNAIYIFIITTFSRLSGNIIIVVFCFVLMAVLEIKVALLLIFALPLNYFGFKKINNELTKKSDRLQSVTSNGYKEIFSLWRNADFIKQFASPNPLIQKSESALTPIFECMAHVNKFAQGASAALKLTNTLIQNISLLIVGLSVLENDQPITTVIVTSIILPLYFTSLNTIVSSNLEVSELNTTINFARRLQSMAESDSADQHIERIESIRIKINELSIGGITRNVNIDTEIHKGDIVKIEGASGSGKSTFIRLLLKFRLCQDIFFNGINIRQLRAESIRSRIKYIPQEPVIFPFSIAENIRFGSERDIDLINLSKNRILAPVLKEKSLDTMILENGANLSGGEKQRIAICRAVQNDFDVLILDEITSNLDFASAQSIYDDIFAQYANKIIFVITHDHNVILPTAKRISFNH